MDIKSIIKRINNIIVHPAKEWLYIAKTPTPKKDLLTNFLLPIVLLVSLSKLLGGIQLDESFSLVTAFFSCIIVFIVSMSATFITAVLIKELSPAFDAKKDLRACLNLSVYSTVPFFATQFLANLVADLFFMPIGGLYGLYIFWTGSRRMLNVPDEKKIPFLLFAGLLFPLLYYSTLTPMLKFGEFLLQHT